MEAPVIGQGHDLAMPMSRAAPDPASTPCLKIS
jgi:hypothetical protein